MGGSRPGMPAMVKISSKENPEGVRQGGPYGADKKLYQCEECGFHYENKEWAEKCEAWCREHKSCNLEIVSHAEENKS